MVKDFERQPEFSRPVTAAQIGEAERIEEITASEEERAALAERFGWTSMRRLNATVRLRRLKSDLIRVSGRYGAELEQPCVVTLDPVPAHIDGDFSLLYASDGRRDEAEVVITPADEDPPEPIVDGRIDIGEAVVQQLAIALDPYPRAPGAALPESLAETGGDAEERRSNPFESLAKLKGDD